MSITLDLLIWIGILSPLIILIMIIVWYKYTERQIHKQYKERMDDE